MNERKVCFITCVNDRNAYSECLSFLSELEIPEGFEVDSLSIEGAGSMTEGYQAAMSQSDAKYKVYLHQDVLIINKRFIFDIVRIFEQQPEVGLLGVAGAIDMPPSGIWWQSWNRVGQVYESHTGKMELLTLREIGGQAQPVAALDGLILVTQYDVPWNTRDFDGWHFYDMSQCMEFRRHGFQAAVAPQESPWCIHDCGLVNVRNGFETYRQRYLAEYKEQYPLVSVLIPTYNRPQLFELALQSVLQQTYPHIEIVIGDDSTNEETAELMQPYLAQYPHIRYYKNERNLGQFANDLKLMELAEGEFVNFLMDDDLFHPEKISCMMSYFMQDADRQIALVTSHRELIDGDGQKLGNVTSNARLADKDTLADGILFGDSLLQTGINYIGEPTTVLFRKNLLVEPFGMFAGRKYSCNVDLASWMNLLSKGKIVYISQTLSYFRLHEGQQLNIDKNIPLGFEDIVHQVLNCRAKGFLQDPFSYRKALSRLIREYISVNQKMINKGLEEYRSLVEESRIAATRELNKQPAEELSGTELLESGYLERFALGEKDTIASRFTYKVQDKLFVSQNAPNIGYADGSEQFMIKLFDQLEEISPDGDNLIPYIKDWASLYHLSYVRTNLFDVVEDLFDTTGNALELGGGMGAVTHWLGRKFNQVDVIEGSPFRAKANVLRNKSRDNVNLFVDDLMNLSFPRKGYKLATLIGVLEYIPYFAGSNDPEKTCEGFLSALADHLDEEGILMIAIENKLGAKYFSGCKEDHNSTLFSGIHGYPDRSAITFSRNELKTVLEKAGYNQIQFYHCFPDYKFPKTVIREDERMYDWNLSSIARGLFPDNGNPREYTMHDALLLNSLAKAQLVHEFSNSFLVLCSKSTKVNLKTDALITKYSNAESTKKQFHHKIEFVSEEKGNQVRRIPMYGNPTESTLGKLTYRIRDERYLGGESLSIEAYRAAIRKDDYKSLAELLREVHDKLISDYGLNEFDDEGYAYVDGKAVDFVLNNLVRTSDGQLRFVDGKWSTEETLTSDYVLYRNVFNLFQEIHPFIEETTGTVFITRILLALFPQMNEERMLKHVKADSTFHTLVNLVPYHPRELHSGKKDKALAIKLKSLR